MAIHALVSLLLLLPAGTFLVLREPHGLPQHGGLQGLRAQGDAREADVPPVVGHVLEEVLHDRDGDDDDGVKGLKHSASWTMVKDGDDDSISDNG